MVFIYLDIRFTSSSMNFLKKLIWGETIEIHDEFFGKLTAEKVKKNTKSVQWNSIYPNNIDGRVLLSFVGNKEGVSEKAKKRVKKLLNDYESKLKLQLDIIFKTDHKIDISNFQHTNVIVCDEEAFETIFAYYSSTSKVRSIAVNVYFKDDESYSVEIIKENVHFK